MKITVKRDELVQGIVHVSKAVSPRTVIPILSGIKFEADSRGLTLTGSDSDISISYHIPVVIEDEVAVQVEQEGKIVLPAKFITDIVKKLPGEQVAFHVMDHHLTSIQSGSAEFNLHGLDAEEYPRLPQIDEESSFTVPSQLLKNLIRQTIIAVSTSESRPILTGVQWTLKEDRLIFVATDSHRLAQAKIRVEGHTDAQVDSVVIPGKSLNELNKILEENQDPVEIVISGNQLLVRTQRLLFYSRMLEGNYPDTSRIIPTSSQTRIVVETKQLYEALERASLIAAKDRNNVVRISTISREELEIYSFSPEIGKLSETIPLNGMEGDELKISFNAKYMLDALRVIDSPEIEIGFNGAMSPFIIRPFGQEDPLHLIVPVRTY